VEYRYIQRNPASGKRRRLPTTKLERAYRDLPDHLAALLDCAGKLDDAPYCAKASVVC
jgi:hypothetical protein